MKVLFVCSGNICRSPMAAAYLRHRAARDVAAGSLTVDSAGTLGINGARASAEALRVLEEIGVDGSSHRSKGIEQVDLAEVDLIVGMEREHVDGVIEASPACEERCRLIRAFEHGAEPASSAPGLDDPIGMPLEFYRRQLGLITRCVDHLARHLERGDGPARGG